MNSTLFPPEPGNPVPLPRARSLALLPRETLSRQIADGSAIQLRHTGGDGHFWVTMEGVRNDVVLSPGQSLYFPGPGLLVVEAIEAPASIRIS